MDGAEGGATGRGRGWASVGSRAVEGVGVGKGSGGVKVGVRGCSTWPNWVEGGEEGGASEVEEWEVHSEVGVKGPSESEGGSG